MRRFSSFLAVMDISIIFLTSDYQRVAEKEFLCIAFNAVGRIRCSTYLNEGVNETGVWNMLQSHVQVQVYRELATSAIKDALICMNDNEVALCEEYLSQALISVGLMLEMQKKCD